MIVQPTFYIPPEVAAGILSGDFIRYGGVVRDTAGRLVTHLKEVPTPEKAVEEVAKRAALSLKNPWFAVGAGALILVAIGGGVVLAIKKRQKEAEAGVPACVQTYKRSLQAYLDAIQNGRLDLVIIDRLVADLDAVIAFGDKGDIAVAISPAQLATLTEIVLDYTSELAKANDIELDEAGESGERTAGGVAFELRSHLETQRHIFGTAA